MSGDVLTVSNLQKRYGEKVAVAGVSFSVMQGEIVGLLGPNGAGKTSIVSMVLNVLEPTDGSIFITGIDLAVERSRALALTNFAATYSQLPGNLTVYQNLRVFGLLYSVPDLARRIEELLSEFSLEQFRDTKTGVLSSGEQARVCIAKAMLNKPRLLLLDEPTASLDPVTARDIRNNIRGFAKQQTEGVLWTSHNMHEVEEVCDRVLFLFEGKILLEGAPKELIDKHGALNLEELFISVVGQQKK